MEQKFEKLSNEQLNLIAGGADIVKRCPGCGKEYLLACYDPDNMIGMVVSGSKICNDCGTKFTFHYTL